MGNAVRCGLDVEAQEQAEYTRRKSMRSRAASRHNLSSPSNRQDSHEGEGQKALADHPPDEVSNTTEAVLPRPLSSVFIQRSVPADKVVENTPRSKDARQSRSRRASQAAASRKYSAGRAARYSSNYNSRAQYRRSSSGSSHPTDAPTSNEMSFSIPEIDSRPSSAGSADRVSANAESYSFGSHASGEEHNYAFDQHDGLEGRSSPLPGSFLEAMPPKESPATVTSPEVGATGNSNACSNSSCSTSNTAAAVPPLKGDFTAWDMGFGIISGAQRVSPLGSVSVSKNQPSPMKNLTMTNAQALHNHATVNTKAEDKEVSTTHTTVTPSEEPESIAGSEETKQPAEAMPKGVQTAEDARVNTRHIGKNTRQPLLSAAEDVRGTSKVAAGGTTTTLLPDLPQQRRVSCMAQTKPAPSPSTTSAPTRNATAPPTRQNATTSPSKAGIEPAKTGHSPAMKPQRTTAAPTPPLDQVEPYDLHFLNAAESPRATSVRINSAGKANSTAVPTTKPQSNTTHEKTSSSNTNSVSAPPEKKPALPPPMQGRSEKATGPGTPSPGTAHPAKPLGLPTLHNGKPSPSTVVKDHATQRNSSNSITNNKNTNVSSKPQRVDAAVSTSPTAAAKPAPKSGGSPAPATMSATAHLSNELKIGSPFPPSASGVVASPATQKSGQQQQSTTTPTTVAAAVYPAKPSPSLSGPSSSPVKTKPVTAAADPAAAATIPLADPNAPPSPIFRPPKKKKSSSHAASHRKKGHKKRNKHRRVTQKMYGSDATDNDEDDHETDGEDSYGTQDLDDTDADSEAGQSQESLPNLGASQKVDSILMKSSSFKSRSGSVGPQDLTAATGSVSFLLGEKEAELAMASSQLMSKAVPRRRKERLRRMNEDFGMGVLSDIEGDAQATAHTDQATSAA